MEKKYESLGIKLNKGVGEIEKELEEEKEMLGVERLKELIEGYEC